MEPRWCTVAQADCTRAESSHLLARLMEALFCLPADRLLPGHTPAQLVRCLGVGNCAMLPPVSARITAAVSAAMPGIVCNSSYSRSKGWSFCKVLWLSSGGWVSQH